MNKIKFIHHDLTGKVGKYDEKFSVKKAEEVLKFHKSIPEYSETPLVNLSDLAKHLGVSNIWVKDESYRFGLNAFKALGGSYSIGSYIADKYNLKDFTFTDIKKYNNETFVTATDGNHGRGIAWMAHQIGAKSMVFMPKGSALERLNNIKALGSDASITEYNYDDSVRIAKKTAEEHGWPLVQDTAWPGYEKIPTWIMQGYLSMALESFKKMDKAPTHVFLQSGVGAMAGSITAFCANYFGKDKPIITIVEPNNADCIYKSAEANDGKPHNVTGDLKTIMAGLACGEPCTIGLEEMLAYAENYVSMPDYVAANGMRVLGNPIGNDKRIISGESGASTMGFVYEVLTNPDLAQIKKTLNLNEKSRIFCISTEGDTDKQNYRDIVWGGKYSLL